MSHGQHWVTRETLKLHEIMTQEQISSSSVTQATLTSHGNHWQHWSNMRFPTYKTCFYQASRNVLRIQIYFYIICLPYHEKSLCCSFKPLWSTIFLWPKCLFVFPLIKDKFPWDLGRCLQYTLQIWKSRLWDQIFQNPSPAEGCLH